MIASNSSSSPDVRRAPRVVKLKRYRGPSTTTSKTGGPSTTLVSSSATSAVGIPGVAPAPGPVSVVAGGMTSSTSSPDDVSISTESLERPTSSPGGGGNSWFVPTRTASMRNTASRNRASVFIRTSDQEDGPSRCDPRVSDVHELKVREPGRLPDHPMDDTDRFDATPTIRLESLREFRVTRWHRPNMSASTDTTAASRAKSPPGRAE